MPSEFWANAHILESLWQLRHDIEDTTGRLVTKCFLAAKADPSCSSYWQGEAQYWDGQRQEALKLVDNMIRLAGAGRPQRVTGSRSIEINNVSGDVIIAEIHDSDNVAVGKDISQDIE